MPLTFHYNYFAAQEAMARHQLASVGVSGADGVEGQIRRSTLSPDHLITRPAEGIDTMVDVLNYARKKFGSKKLIGSREVVREHKEQKAVKKMVDGEEVEEMKTWTYFELSPFSYITLNEFCDLVELFAIGLHKIGLTHKDRFNIFASTAMSWQVAAHACLRLGSTFCTAYDTLGPEGLHVSLEEPEVRGIFTNADHLKVLDKVIDSTPLLHLVIYDGEADPQIVASIREKIKTRENGRIISMEEVLRLGHGEKVFLYNPKPEDLACIMYTSGSTGKPKGVMLTHANLVATLAAISLLTRSFVSDKDSLLAFLPLAHILEFVVENFCFLQGITIGYARVKTLTSASVRNCDGDLVAFKPTIMVGVPAVWEQIRKGILSKVHSSSSIKQRLFSLGMWAKQHKVPGLAQAADALVFKAVREQTGGRLRYALSGGAALSLATHKFLNNALVTIIQGYGMTESSAMCAILTPDYFKYGCVGCPMPSVEVKLCDIPEAGYYSSNNPPQGEVMIRGASVTQGYFKRPDLTAEAITEDGWLKTGDVGEWNADGTLNLIDRKKNLVKLAGGEYIAIERLESTYKSCNYVSNLCVIASSDANKPMAIVFPREETLRKALPELGLDSMSHEELDVLCKQRKVREFIQSELLAVAKESDFAPMEQLQTVILIDEELPLTAAQKVQRKEVEHKYKDRIAAVYP